MIRSIEHQPSDAEIQERMNSTDPERIASLDVRVDEHTRHLLVINGSIGDVGRSLGEQSVQIALIQSSVDSIKKSLDHNEDDKSRRQGMSLQLMLGLLAATIAIVGIIVTIILTFVVLFANGQL